MSVAEIYENRATFSFEVFPPKTDVGMEKLCGKDGVLEKLYTLNPDYISCTYGAGGTNVGKNLEVLDKIVKDGKTTPVTHFTCIGNTKEDIKEKLQTYLDHGINHMLALRGDLPFGWTGTNGDLHFVYTADFTGCGIALGDLTINKTVYPEAQLLKPSELTAAILQTGGLIFVDNSDESALAHTVNGTSVNAGQTSALVLIGRYKEREQAALTLPEMRCNRNVAVMNLHLIGNTDNTFTTTNAKNLNPDLLLVDCTLDVKRYFIYDNNGNWSFNNILINNSFVMYPVGATNQPALYSITTTAKAGGYPMQSIKLTNNVLYATAPTQAYILQCGNNAQYDTKNLRIEITGNTLYNIYQPNIMIRAYVLAGLTVTKNVGYYTGVTAKSYLTGVYDTAGFTADKAEVTYNYLYTAPVSDTNFWSAKHTGSYTPANNQMGDGVEAPFSSMDAAKGYFPVDASVVKTGAGATYDTKAWFKAE